MNFRIQNRKLKYISALIYLLFQVLLCAVLNAQIETKNKHPITIDDAIEMALKHNLELAAVRKTFDQAEAQLIRSSLLFPANPRISSEIGTRNSPESRNTDYNVSLSQEFEVFGQRRKRIQVARKNIDSVKFQIEDRERKIMAQVKSTFFQALTNQEIVKLQLELVDIFKRLWDATQERYKAGAICVLELNTIQIQFGISKQNLLTAKNSLQNILLNLKLLLGMEKEKPLNIIGELNYKPFRLYLNDLLNSALDYRPDLKTLEFEKERASSEIALRKSEIIPNPELSGFFQREEGSDDIVGGEISISIPIWDRKQSELKRARTSKDIAEIRIENKYMQIQNEVESAYRSFLTAVESVKIFDNEIIPQIDENLKLNEISYREGKINFVGFLTVQNNLIETRTAYLNTLFTYNKAIINLEAVSGIKFRKVVRK